MRSFSVLKNLREYEQRIKLYNPPIDSRIIEEANKYENSLHDFAKAMWPIIEGGRPFIDGWHIQAVCEHLEAVYYGDIKYLLINQPPRTMKSTLVSVAFPTWAWTKNPELQFLYISYGSKLSQKDSVKSRRIIDSKWYKEKWGSRVQLSTDVNTKLRFDNTRSGYRIATSVGGAATGEGGDYICWDDVLNAGDAESDVKRTSTNDWCDHVLSTRLNNPKTGAIIGNMQRLHSKDYTGHVLEKNIEGLVHLMLPMEYETSRKCTTIPLKSTKGKPWSDPRKKEGELLWPERVGIKELEKLKAEMNSSYVIAGQLQQRPAPDEGGIIQKNWFQWWKERSPPPCDFILQSWDTAYSDKVTACYSACTNWGIFKDKHGVDNIILLSTWRGRVEHPDLRKMAMRLAECIYDTNIDDPVPMDYILRPHTILIESKANGTPLAQELSRSGLIVNRFDPTPYGKKIQRARLCTGLIESGKVWLPARAPNYDRLRPFADEFLEAAAVFPNDDSADLIDSMSQALIKMRSSGLIGLPDDVKIMSQYKEKKALY